MKIVPTLRACCSPHHVRRVAALMTLAWLLWAPGAAVAFDLAVSVRGQTAEIGRDLLLDLVVSPMPGESLDMGSLSVEVTVAGSTDFLGTPYPVRTKTGGDGSVTLEWAAPVPGRSSPGTHGLEVRVAARTSDGVAVAQTWQGAFTTVFGEGWSADRIQNFLDNRGLGFFLVLVFGFGLLMSLSPCIYPMIPITLAVIGARSQEKGAWHGLAMSVTYVLGMALVYAILGALSATVFSGITAFMQSPVVLVPIALLLLVLSFSMFGAYELQAPAFLRDRLQGPGGGRGGFVGVFAMGLVSGLVASPCVGPFLAALLVWVAATGDWVLGFFSLLIFGLGMGMLLIGVGTFPALLGTLPRSGGWMETVKKAMGLLLVAMAFYFVRPGAVLPPQVFYPALGLTSVIVAVFMGAFDRPDAAPGWWPRARMGLAIGVFVAGLYFLIGSFLVHGFVMPSPLMSGAASKTTAVPIATKEVPVEVGSTSNLGSAVEASELPGKVQWEIVTTGGGAAAVLTARREAARLAGKPVMIDFWANWCLYCKKLDKTVWNVPAVVAESTRFETIKIDATAPDDAEMEAIKAEFQVVGLPRVVFIDSRGTVMHARSVGFLTAEQMLEQMQGIR